MSNNSTTKLLPQHIDDLRRSGSSDETTKGGGLVSVGGAANLRAMPNMKGGGDKLVPALVFPFRSVVGIKNGFCRIKPDNPFTDKEGKVAKYLSPRDGGVRAYFPP